MLEPGLGAVFLAVPLFSPMTVGLDSASPPIRELPLLWGSKSDGLGSSGEERGHGWLCRTTSLTLACPPGCPTPDRC